MLYVLINPQFNAGLERRLHRFRRAHEPARAKLVAPHITLVFGLGPEHASGLPRLCQATVRGLAPFRVTFSHSVSAYDPFEQIHKLFLICDEGKHAIKTLHHWLYDGLQASGAKMDRPYEPHMTVASHPDPQYISQLDAHDIGPFPIAGEVQSLNVVKFDGEHLTVLKRIPLSG